MVQSTKRDEEVMDVQREDHLLTRLLLSEGVLSYEKLARLIAVWQEKYQGQRLLKALIAEKLVGPETLRKLESKLKQAMLKPESETLLSKLDSIFCGLAVKRRLVSPEAVKICRRVAKSEPSGSLPVAQALIKKHYLKPKFFFELKLEAENTLYSYRLRSLLQKQADLTANIRMDELTNVKVEKRKRSSIPESVAAAKAAQQKILRPRKGRGPNDPLPERFANYRILEEVAVGGMGTIYKAVQIGLDRVVALKVLRRKEESDDRIKRFKREADAVSRLNHPNIVRLHEVDVWQGRHYFSMDFIDGIPLDVLIKEAEVALDDLIQVAIEMARAIHYAHKLGVIHRDLKPANVIVDLDGHPQITDFGLAKIVDCETLLTKSDTILGTPYYMAPEQTRGETRKISPKTDVWGLGVILYEMATGTIPFKAQSTIELYHKINHLDPPLPQSIRPDIPDDIQNIILKCIEKEPTYRYPDAASLADDLQRYLNGKCIMAKKVPEWRKNLRKLLRRRKILDMTAGIILLILGFLGLKFFWDYLENQRLEQDRIEDRHRQEQLRRSKMEMARALLEKARSYTYQEDYGEALGQVEKALSLIPDFAGAYLQRARIHLCIARHLSPDKRARQQQYRQRALKDLQFVLRLPGKHLQAHLLQAEIWACEGQYDKALQEYELILQDYPDSIPAHKGRGWVYQQSGRHQAAIEDFERVFEFSPRDQHTHLLCATSYWALACQNKDKRTFYLDKCRYHLGKIKPEQDEFAHRFEFYLLKGRVAYSAGNQRQALTNWRRALDCAPTPADADKVQGLIKKLKQGLPSSKDTPNRQKQ